MLIKINKTGKFKSSNWATFDAVINEFFTISGVASYKDLELEENTTYKDLYLRQSQVKTKEGKTVIVFNIFK